MKTKSTDNVNNNNYFFKQEVVFSSLKGNAVSIALVIVWFLCNSLVLYFKIHSLTFISEGFKTSFLEVEYSLPLFFLGIFFQEMIKSLMLKFLAKVKFSQQLKGFSLTSFMPYVHSKYPINVQHYRLILITSSLILLPTILLTYFFQWYSFLYLSSFWLLFSGYDLYSAFLIKTFDSSFVAADHPDMPGVVIYHNPFID